MTTILRRHRLGRLVLASLAALVLAAGLATMTASGASASVRPHTHETTRTLLFCRDFGRDFQRFDRNRGRDFQRFDRNRDRDRNRDCRLPDRRDRRGQHDQFGQPGRYQPA